MRLTKRHYIQATVAYADIFGYPLTEDDVYYWSIKHAPSKNFRIHSIGGIQRHNYFLFLKGRKHILSLHDKRKHIAKKKWAIARRVGYALRCIPTIFLVGVTGGVAMNNASAHDDIDFFFITAKGTLWITRLLVTVLLDVMGVRRKPGEKRVANKICINMFMSEEALGIPKKEQDLFAAHEVLQMEPLWSRRDIYRRFLQANHWVKNFLPVAWSIKQSGRNQHPKISYWYSRVARGFLRWFEVPAKMFQLWYMNRRRTREVITSGVLRFHPRDARTWIRAALAKRLIKYNVPLDNIFYDL